MIVTERDQLRSVVAELRSRDSFFFDLETTYTASFEEWEEAERIRAIPSKARNVDEDWWLRVFDLKPTDPRVNEITWISFASYGLGAAIPVAHPKGVMLKPKRHEMVPVSQLYEPGDDRLYTKIGDISRRKVKRVLPAEFGPPPPQLSLDLVLEEIEPLFFDDRMIGAHNLQFDVPTIQRYFGAWPTAPFMDTIIAVHVTNEKLHDYKLDSLNRIIFKQQYEKLGSKGVGNFSFTKAGRYAEEDSRYEWLHWRKVKREHFDKSPRLRRYLHDYAMPVVEVLMHMEWEGVEIDTEAMGKQREARQLEVDDVMERIIVDYGAPPDFNPNADDQKRALIYDQHGGVPLKITEKQQLASVDAESMAHVAAQGGTAGEVATLLLEWADSNKELSTYLIGPPYQLDTQGRAHVTYKLHGTETGRLSCTNFNIQNIPKGSIMRSMYRAPKGYVYVVGDYDQIELRHIAKRADDRTLIGLFVSGEDIHRGTAALVLAKDFDDVEEDERQRYGKMPNFLLGYGGEALNLSVKAGISLKRAEWVLAQYFRRFSAIKPWKRRVIAEAKANARFVERDGRRKMVVPPYVETMLGRRRRLPMLFTDEFKERSAAERQAVNTIIQGSAAETTYLAMLELHRLNTAGEFPIRLVINVHDELVATVPERHADDGVALLRQVMQDVRVPHTGERPLGDEIPLAAKVSASDVWEK